MSKTDDKTLEKLAFSAGDIIAAGIASIMVSRIISGKKFNGFLKWTAVLWLVQVILDKFEDGMNRFYEATGSSMRIEL